MSLDQKTCVPCREGAEPLSPAQAQDMLAQVPGWQLQEGKLVRQLQLKDFAAAVEMLNTLAEIAEKQDHHPNLFLHSWNKLRITLYTHKINGLHENDFILAAKINNALTADE